MNYQPSNLKSQQSLYFFCKKKLPESNHIAIDFRYHPNDNAHMEKYQNMIRELLAAGMSQQSIADGIGKSQAWVSGFIHNAYESLKIDDAEAIKRFRYKHRSRLSRS